MPPIKQWCHFEKLYSAYLYNFYLWFMKIKLIDISNLVSSQFHVKSPVAVKWTWPTSSKWWYKLMINTLKEMEYISDKTMISSGSKPSDVFTGIWYQCLYVRIKKTKKRQNTENPNVKTFEGFDVEDTT